jgi:hypothetical protein
MIETDTAPVADLATPTAEDTGSAVEETTTTMAEEAPALSPSEQRLQSYGFRDTGTDDTAPASLDTETETPAADVTEPTDDDAAEGNDEDEEALETDAAPAIAHQLQKYRKRAQAAEAERDAIKAEAEQSRAQAVADLETELMRLKAQKLIPAPTPQNPLSDIVSAKQLGEIEQGLTQIGDWFEDNAGRIAQLDVDHEGNPETLEVEWLSGKDRFQTREGLERIRAANRAERRAIPQRRAWLQQAQQISEAVQKDFPELRQANSPLRQAVDRVLIAAPEIKRFPGSELIALQQVIGAQVLSAKRGQSWQFVQALHQAPAAPAAKAPAKPTPAKPSRQAVPGKSSTRPTAAPRAAKSIATPSASASRAGQRLSASDKLRGYGMPSN